MHISVRTTIHIILAWVSIMHIFVLSIAVHFGNRYKVVTSLCAICLSSYRLCTHVYVRVMVVCDVSVRECAFSRMAAGDESVLAPRALCAGGLAPGGMPVANSLSAMFFIAESAI